MPLLLRQHISQPLPLKLSALLFASLLLSGCEIGNSPSTSIEVAVKGLYSGSISSDGTYSLAGSIHHGGSLWRSGKNERLYNWNHKKGEYSNIIASGFSPDNNFALTADHQTMVLWDTQAGQALTFWTAPNEVLDIALTSNGNYAFLGLGDNSAVLFNVKQGGVKRSFYHRNRVNAVDLSDDGTLAITGSDDNTARLWDVNTGKELFNWQHEDEVVTVALSPSGDKAFTVAKYDRAVIWDTQTGKAIGQLPLIASSIRRGQAFTSASFSSDGKQLLTGDTDRTVQLWDSKTLKPLYQWRVPKRSPWKPTSASVLAVSFTPKKGQYLALASNGFSHQLKR
ncbi:MAG: WD40 repeat protein [Pseudohongiellaceae bacterium]|jgi:WD40 repeat protein